MSALAGPGLALSGPEVQDVAATWPGGVAADSEHGSADALATALVTSDLVHIAAHGQHNQDNPLFSSIRMADGPLYAYDVPPDEPVAGHIVLSACDLGLTTPRAGGEVLGLTAALLSIGATSVVSSVSRVDDTTAYETMLRYHRLLAGGLDSPTALAEALDGDVDMPAAFVCFGSPWSVTRLGPAPDPNSERRSTGRTWAGSDPDGGALVEQLLRGQPGDRFADLGRDPDRDRAGGDVLVTTELAPIWLSSPRLMSPRTLAPDPIVTRSPTVGCRLTLAIDRPPSVTSW